EADERRVLVDAGLFQGDRAWRRRNWEQLSVDPATIESVVVTHAHLDHCGYLPVLVREGFAGQVVCSPRTARLMAIVVRDAGHILGSRFAAVSGHGSRIVFSGDLGRTDHPLLLPPEQPGGADYFVVESTYGDRLHAGHAADELAGALTRTLGRGGVALLPAFA